MILPYCDLASIRFLRVLALRGTPIKNGDRELTQSYMYYIDIDLSRSNIMHHLGLCLNKVPQLVQWKICYQTKYI